MIILQSTSHAALTKIAASRARIGGISISTIKLRPSIGVIQSILSQWYAIIDISSMVAGCQSSRQYVINCSHGNHLAVLILVLGCVDWMAQTSLFAQGLFPEQKQLTVSGLRCLAVSSLHLNIQTYLAASFIIWCIGLGIGRSTWLASFFNVYHRITWGAKSRWGLKPRRQNEFFFIIAGQYSWSTIGT